MPTRKEARGVGLLLFFCAFFPHGALADKFDEALKLLDEKKYQKSQAVLEELVGAEPSNGLYWFNLGSASFNLADYERAEKAFRKVIELESPLAPGARLCLVKVLRKLGRLAEAKALLEKTKALDTAGDLGQQIESEAKLIAQIATDDTSKAFWLTLDEGLGYDSNVFLDGVSVSGTAQPIAETQVNAGYQTPGEIAFGRLSYQLYSKETLGFPSGRFLSQTARLLLGVETSDWSIQLSPAFQHQIFGLTSYLIRGLADVSVRKRIGDVAPGLQYQLGRNFAQDAQYSFLDGNTHAGNFFLDFFSESAQTRLLYGFAFDDIGDLVSGTARLPLKGYAHGPGFKWAWGSASWQVLASVLYLFRSYEQRALPGNVVRRDRQLNSTLSISCALSGSFSLFTSGSLLVNRSTLDETSNVSDRNYTQVLGVAGVSWKIVN